LSQLLDRVSYMGLQGVGETQLQVAKQNQSQMMSVIGYGVGPSISVALTWSTS
jgi:hypothetical protein